MKKRLLYLEDLYDFYSNTYKRSTRFDAQKSGSPIVVQVHGKVNFTENDKDTEGLCPVHLQACHTNLNINGSNISDDVMTSALPSFSNRPILGYIHIVDGQPEFYSHNMHEDDDGNIVYDEVPIGIIPESCNAQLVYDEDKKKTYCEVDGYIFEEYSKASEILKREEECSVSVELSIRSLSYNAKEKYLDIEDFFFSGVTILGKTPDGEVVKPGMEKSNIKLADFSEKNNGLFSKYEDKMIEMQERLNKLESACFNKYHSKEGGNEETMFEKLLEKYGKTVKDIDFDYESLSDEELEQKFAKLFDKEEKPEGFEEEPSDDGEGGDGSKAEGNTDNGENSGEDENPEENPDNGSYSVNPEKYSITMSDGSVKDFALSLDEITSALYTLVNNMYADDDTWYSVTVYEDNTLIMSDWWNGKYFKQSYTRDGDNFSLVGDRIAVHSVWITDEEETALNEMRSNYAALKEFKENIEKNELHAQKEEILYSEKYAALAEKNEEGNFVNADFAELVKDMDNYSLTDLETKIKVMHSDFVTEHPTQVTFSAQTGPKKKMTSVKLFANPNNDKKTKPSRYGNLFKESK